MSLHDVCATFRHCTTDIFCIFYQCASINHYIQIGTLIYDLKVARKKEYYVNVMLLKFMVVKIQYREKRSVLGNPAYCAQITRS